MFAAQVTRAETVHSLIYVSSAVELFTKEALLDLLNKSRRNNTAAGVTGMLLYKDGNFMQALEGPKAQVLSVHARIQSDPRHTGLITMLERTERQRQFSEWSMGFRDLSDETLRGEAGYNEFLNLSFNDPSFRENPTRAQRLLLKFREMM